jgi:hypothetical protein
MELFKTTSVFQLIILAKFKDLFDQFEVEGECSVSAPRSATQLRSACARAAYSVFSYF